MSDTIFFNTGLICAAVGLGIIGAGLLRHITGLRTLIPRLFDEYKQNRISETLKEFDNNLDTTSKVIITGIVIYFLGFAISFLSIGMYTR